MKENIFLNNFLKKNYAKSGTKKTAKRQKVVRLLKIPYLYDGFSYIIALPTIFHILIYYLKTLNIRC